MSTILMIGGLLSVALAVGMYLIRVSYLMVDRMHYELGGSYCVRPTLRPVLLELLIAFSGAGAAVAGMSLFVF